MSKLLTSLTQKSCIKTQKTIDWLHTWFVKSYSNTKHHRREQQHRLVATIPNQKQMAKSTTTLESHSTKSTKSSGAPLLQVVHAAPPNEAEDALPPCSSYTQTPKQHGGVHQNYQITQNLPLRTCVQTNKQEREATQHTGA